ncbi:hypothetical protein FO519_004033 [Halicephalobus sp. NKZ332]|nr:hypothetical protein FO519_004033 [Halicephalobus sp. NKZ332]
MKFLLSVLFVCNGIVLINAQYGIYGGLSLPGLENYPRYGSYRDPGYSNRPYLDNYRDGYGGYSPYSSGSYPENVNSNYDALGDISAAFLRSLSEFLLGPEPEPFPYGPLGPFQPGGRNRYQNQYGYGVNAGVYAGTYGGQSITGPRGSHGGILGWPLFPWIPTIAPPVIQTTPSPATTTSTTTASTAPLPPPTEEENLPTGSPPEGSVVEVPITNE